MRSVAGVVIFAIGAICAIGSGVWGLTFVVPVARELAGLWAAIAASVLFPITLVVGPWCLVAMNGSWTPLVIVYGGGIVAMLLMGAGSAVVVSHLGSNSGFGRPRRRLAFWRRSET